MEAFLSLPSQIWEDLPQQCQRGCVWDLYIVRCLNRAACPLYILETSILYHPSQSVGHSSCFCENLSPGLHHWKVSVPHWSAVVRRGPHGGVHRHRRPPARSNGQWGILGPFQSRKSPSAPAQLHGRRLSLCLVNYQTAPAFTVAYTPVAR